MAKVQSKIKIEFELPKDQVKKIKDFGKMLKPIVKDLKKITLSVIIKTWLIKKLNI